MYAEVALPLPLDKTFHYSVPENLNAIVKRGIRVNVPFGNKKLIGYVVSLLKESNISKIKDISSVVDTESVLTDEMFYLAEWIAKNYICSLGEAFAVIMSPALSSSKRNLKSIEENIKEKLLPVKVSHKLSDSQKSAVTEIVKSINKKEFNTFLLHGITSSGKTEVYLSAIEEIIKQQRSAIFLLPEISLTPHFIRLIQDRFPQQLGVWHSGLSKSEKYRTWENAKKGRIKIILGPRSAIFAPFGNLGLIIMDEEHEPTYKQEQKPTYHARDVALERARANNAVLILGSATPSLETYLEAKNKKYRLLELKERIGSGILPPVEIVDSKNQYKRSKILSEPLIEALNKTLARREQAIIFLNRRGFAPGVMCQNCAQVLKCPNCSISLVYHYDAEKLKCHYCNYSSVFPKKCPSCNSSEIYVFGVGTQKVEQELKKFYPQGKIIRLDRDTAAKKGVYQKVYEDFKKENFDILLGTQMIAKGFDFPRVTLVGVIDADTSLYFPDFRSAERTFQLLTQVAGRSGRSYLGGEVIIQTRHPQHYALQNAKNHDFISFYEKEIEYRKEMYYPPFSRLANIIIRSKNELRLIEFAEKFAAELKRFNDKTNLFSILGPTPASRTKLHGMFRWQILLKGEKSAIIQAILETKKIQVPSGILVTADIDPYDIL
ncbi:MAG: primosomal protein N' [Elusimicrobia bacterium]|nr:primosomal protein N' [Elusimicrobiota bacterium]